MDLNEFEKDRQIDPTQLDMEAIRQPELFFKWAARSIEAKGDAEQAKTRLTVTEARLEHDCRAKPTDFGLAKVTENSIKAAVHFHQDWDRASDTLRLAKLTADMLGAAKEAMEQKKRMIEILVTMHGQSYFAGPSIPRDLAEIWLEKNKAAGRRTTEKIKKRVRRRKKRKSDD